MNWTLSDPTSDTYLFRAFLSNEDQGLFQGNASIADSSELCFPPSISKDGLGEADQCIANATALFVSILLPRVATG